MKFFKLLFFASLAIAAPAVHKVEPRQSNSNTAISTIYNSVNILDRAVTQNVDSIRQTIQAIRDSTDATVRVQLEATLRTNYRNIINALQTSTRSIVSVTTGAAGGINNQLFGLSQSSLDTLANSLRTTQRILTNLGVSVRIAITDLTPDAFRAVTSEVNAIRQAIAPFVRPLVTFAQAASRAGASIGLDVYGVNEAIAGIGDILQDLVETIGLPVFTTDGGAGIPGGGRFP